VAVLIRRVVLDEVWPGPANGDGAHRDTVDLRIVGDRITEIEPRLRRRRGEDEIDGHGGQVLPGLHDHHVHLWAWAAAASSVRAGPPEVRSKPELARALRSAPGSSGSWVRAIGYHESVAGDIDRAALDRLVPGRPVRIQHRSGALWILNSRALESVGLEPGRLGCPEDVQRVIDPPQGGAERRDVPGSSTVTESIPAGVEFDAGGRPTGRVWRADGWLRDRLTTASSARPDLGAISRRAAAAGVTGFTDATPDHDEAALAALMRAHGDGTILQRLHLMIGPDQPEADGRSTPSAFHGRVTSGPVKLLLDDVRLPGFDELVALIRRTHARRQAVAVHCVTRTQAALTVAALAEAGAVTGDRIEHGAVLGADLLPSLRRLGVTVVTQPGFVLERGDRYLADVARDDLGDLWRLGSLLGAGIPVGLSTDAPFGPDDPWAVIAAACSRLTADGRSLGPTERIAPRRAVALFGGRPERPGLGRVVAPGAEADLVVLADPLDDALSTGPPRVLGTVVAGAVVYRADAG
jgi:predicted amidohydrolase YtcJ